MEWFVVFVSAVASLVTSDRVCCVGLLGELDDVRAEAFASSDPGRLGDVYAPGSAAATTDAALIRDYARRGGRVVGADLIMLSCTARHASAGQVTLVVVDQLAQARVEWSDGTTRALPRDLPTRRIVTLIRTADGWRIA